MTRASLLVSALALTSACARPQWIVSISTDANVPQLGDRLLVQVLRRDGTLACGAPCQRLLGVGDASSWPVSFGIAGDVAAGEPLDIRARLFRADHASFDGLPDSAYIDSISELSPSDGVTSVALPLSSSCFGVAADRVHRLSCNPATGALGPVEAAAPSSAAIVLQPGSWAPGRTVPCPRAVPAGMACVPGGAFVLGGVTGFALFVDDTMPERLVTLSPFALDVDELKVKDLVPLIARGLPPPALHDDNVGSAAAACTYRGNADDATSELPVNCISPATAEMACHMLGKRLPSEAEWEYAAGNRDLESDYAWGEGDPCDESVVARGRTALEYPDSSNLEVTSCRATATRVLPWGVVSGGSASDRTRAAIFNLGGNVSEIVSDGRFAYTQPCWTPQGKNWLSDPHCPSGQSDDGSTFVARGGNWASYPFAAQVIHRGSYAGEYSSEVGVRCAIGF